MNQSSKLFKFLGILLVVGLLFAALPTGQVKAATITVNSGESIQAAINGATAGDTITVGPGTYTEQLDITKNIILVGAGAGQSIIKAPATLPDASLPTSSVIRVHGASVSVEISNFTITGPGPTGCGSIRSGIYVYDSAYANIHNNDVLDIRDNVLPPSGCQNGVAILVGRQAWSTTGTATIDHNNIIGYQKGGIVVDNSGSNAIISYNIVTGAGTITTTAQNGIQISRGATATLIGNTVSGNSFHNDANESNWGATGVLLYNAGAVVFSEKNILSLNDTNLYIQGSSTVTLGDTIIGASTMPPVVNVTQNKYYTTIQAALDDASTVSGDTITVAAGTYDAFSVVGKSNLTITGAGDTATFITPTTLINTGVGHKYTPSMLTSLFVNNSTGITIQSMAIQSTTATPGSGGADAIVFWNNSTGTIKDSIFQGLYPINGVQTGQGIAVDGGTSVLSLVNTDISGFQKNAIDVVDGNGGATPGDLTVNVTGGTINGAGSTSAIAQNGIVYFNRAGGKVGGSVTGAHISSFDYIPETNSGTGILAFGLGTGSLSISGNTFGAGDVSVSDNTGTLNLDTILAGNSFPAGSAVVGSEILIPPTKLSIAPVVSNPTACTPATTTSVDIMVADLPADRPLQGYSVVLTYDPTKVTIKNQADIVNGGFLADGGFWVNSIDNTLGKATIAYTAFGTSTSTGSGKLATVTFTHTGDPAQIDLNIVQNETVLSDKDGYKILTGSASGATIKRMVNENFNWTSGDTAGSGWLSGISSGFNLGTETFAGAQSLEVKLYGGINCDLMQTDKALIEKFASISQITAPFDIFGNFNYVQDGYWANTREAEYGQTVTPRCVIATATLSGGRVVTAQNCNLTGDPNVKLSLVAEDFDYMAMSNVLGVTAGFRPVNFTMDMAISVKVELFTGAGTTDDPYVLLQTNTSPYPADLKDITALQQYSSPFDIFGTFNYTTDVVGSTGRVYWQNVREAEYGQSKVPTRVLSTVTLPGDLVLTAENLLLTGDRNTILPTISITDFGYFASGDVLGLSAGIGAKNFNFNQATSIKVELFAGTQLLQTNTAVSGGPLFTSGYTAISGPFDIFGTFNYATDYWPGTIPPANWSNVRGDGTLPLEYGQGLAPTRVLATVTLPGNVTITAELSNPTGNRNTILPSVTGTVSMQGRLTRAGVGLTLTGPLYTPYNATSDNSVTNNYAFTAIEGQTYVFTTNQARYLNITADLNKTVAVSGSKTLAAFTLRGGNVAEQAANKVDLGDATMIGGAYGTSGDASTLQADANFDGIVNIQDLAIVGGNFNLTGAAAYSSIPAVQ